MNDRDLVLSQIRQRLEILYQMVEELETGGGEPGTTNYNDLSNKPLINGHTLIGAKTSSDLGLASASDFNTMQSQISSLAAELGEEFAVDNISLNEGSIFPESSLSRLQYHKPIEVNSTLYYFINESGVDYLYSSIPTNGAFPSISYLRIMKNDRKVEFYNTIIETTPTANSDNLVTSGGVYTDQQRQEAEIGAVANRCSKNLLKTSATTQTVNGITFTVNADGTVTISGTATAAATLILATATQINNFLPLGTYKLSGCTGGSTTTYDLRFYHPGDSSTVLNHNGDTQFTRNATKTDSNISILVRSGQVMDNVVIKPMIRDASIEDSTYVPYAPTNRELYEMILAL